MAATTHIINWKSSANKPPMTIVTDPESIYVGDVISISLYSAYPYNLLSPYKGLGSKTVAADSENQLIDEVVDLSGSSDVAAKFPIASVSGIFAAIPIVDEVTRVVVVEAGFPMGALVSVVNQRLVIDTMYKLHGSIRLVYKTFNAQKWTHRAFAKKGSTLLFAQNTLTMDYENVPLSISEKTNSANDSIKIEGYPTSKFGYDPYAHFIVYPASKNVKILTDYGTVKGLRTEIHKIKKEQISFSGKEASASFVIDQIDKFTGYFFDDKGQVISPDFNLSDGILKSNLECYGTGFLSYQTAGTVYQYSAKVQKKDVPGGGLETEITLGTIFAFDPLKKGIAATYDIPQNSVDAINPTDFCTIYTEMLLQEEGAFEKPPNFPTDILFPSGISGDGIIIGDPYLIQKRIHAVGKLYGNDSMDVDTMLVNWESPWGGSEINPDAVYHIDENIPSDASDYAKEQMQSKIKELKAKYGIS